ncbi:capsule biosynthesis protein CapA [Olsenella sp. An285]|uniref:CapA family protein n=1 Tax=Olsenella sp. An285 TaxID=1965621 RepID=UPI000B3998E4|nr:CapA family protein [Olsenella sp. An285]OUO45238.1 capsule biosynthesis protein CapA [Olsenella sp. An285]
MVGRSAQEGRQKRKPHRRGTPIKPAAEEPRRTSGSGAGTRSSGPRATRPAASGGTGPSLPRRQLLVGAAGAAAIVVGGALAARGCAPAEEEPVEPAGPFTVHFVAVGDNLPEIEIAAFADAQAGEEGDGTYDYSPIYEPVKKYIESADLAYVKEETHVGGNEIGPRGYPSFNITDEMADALVETGFDLVGSATNHAYDWGSYGANEHSRAVWNELPVTFAGTAASEEEAKQVATVEKNGITFALLDYTYGVNGYDPEDLPSYAVSLMDKDRIADDVARAREAADVVLVGMHWGTENLMEADETQLEYAQLLADAGADVVLGSHPHVIGPMTWLEGADGHRTLVAYSLGNFLSNHEDPSIKHELEGMLSCDFVKENGSVRIEGIKWVPLVNHTDGSSFVVYALKDYTEELAAEHPILSQSTDPLGWMRDTSADVVNAYDDGFLIDA